jgi:hypothetical protein
MFHKGGGRHEALVEVDVKQLRSNWESNLGPGWILLPLSSGNWAEPLTLVIPNWILPSSLEAVTVLRYLYAMVIEETNTRHKFFFFQFRLELIWCFQTVAETVSAVATNAALRFYSM